MGRGGRGRLIFPKWVEVARYDGAGTSDAGDVDRSLGEIIVDNRNAAGAARVTPRREVPVRLKAQIETDTYQRLQMGGLGPVPFSRMVAVFLAADLEAAGFVDPATRAPLLKVTDRLAAIYEVGTEALILKIDDPPGLYAMSVKPCGFGFGRGGYNLIEVSFESRPPGTVGGGGSGGL